jgi:hypothetical protein
MEYKVGMKTKLEHFALGLILAPLAPLALFMGAWCGSYELLPEKWIPFGAIAGLLLGILADIFLLKRLVTRAYKLGTVFWVAVFLFYTIGIFGFFMGVPVFNAALAIPAGFVVGGKLASENADKLQVHRAAGRTAWFTTGMLALVCAASAFFALVSSSTASDLRGMLGLGFEVTQGMIIGLILVGGATLLAVGWILAVASVRFTHAILQRKT